MMSIFTRLLIFVTGHADADLIPAHPNELYYTSRYAIRDGKNRGRSVQQTKLVQYAHTFINVSILCV